MTDNRFFRTILTGCAIVLAGACSDGSRESGDTAADSAGAITPAAASGTASQPAGALDGGSDAVTGGPDMQATPDARNGAPSAGMPAGDPGTAGAGSPGAPGTASPASSGGAAQTDDGARILTRAATKYAGVRTMRADFSMATTNPLLRTTTNSAGRIYQQRPDRIALRFTEPAGDIMLSDGTWFWVYTPSTNKDQALRAPAGGGGARAVDLQAQFLGDPVKRFSHTLHAPESVNGRMADVLTLVPRGDEPFRSLKVWIDREDALARRFEVTERNGVVRRMVLQHLQVNPTIAAEIFRFTPPAGVRVLEQ